MLPAQIRFQTQNALTLSANKTYDGEQPVVTFGWCGGVLTSRRSRVQRPGLYRGALTIIEREGVRGLFKGLRAVPPRG